MLSASLWHHAALSSPVVLLYAAALQHLSHGQPACMLGGIGMGLIVAVAACGAHGGAQILMTAPASSPVGVIQAVDTFVRGCQTFFAATVARTKERSGLASKPTCPHSLVLPHTRGGHEPSYFATSQGLHHPSSFGAAFGVLSRSHCVGVLFMVLG